jgi:hypothetical protein
VSSPIRSVSSIRGILIVTLLALSATSALAQSRVRVIRDQATIWRPGFTTVATMVRKGTVLDVTARAGAWYEVVIPTGEGARGAVGMIAVSQVELLEGSPPPPVRQPARPATPRATSAPPPAPGAPIGVWGFGQVGYTAFAAHDSFDAVLGHSGGAFFGGGGEVRIRPGVFVEASIERFSGTGERVFVNSGQVFKLGIPDTITITPITFTAGYRFPGRHVAPYVGGGLGSYRFREVSSFADPSENTDQRLTSYHVVGGVEFPGEKWVATAFEVDYTNVPRALGTGGSSAAFGEHNLGGVQVRLKILVGR